MFSFDKISTILAGRSNKKNPPIKHFQLRFPF